MIFFCVKALCFHMFIDFIHIQIYLNEWTYILEEF